MHVAFYTDAEEIGGAERVLLSILGALPNDIRATVLGTDERIVDALAERRPGAAKAVLPRVRNKWHASAIAEHVGVLRRLRPDVLHANLRHPWSCQYAILAGVLVRRTHVVAVEHAPIAASTPLQRRLTRTLASRVAVHVAVGWKVARALEALVDLPGGTIRTIHNGVDSDVPPPAALLAEGSVIGAIGRFSVGKRLDLVVRTLPELPDVTAVLVGDGPERAAVERLTHDLGVGERVVFTGWRSDARALLSTFDALVLPSSYEGLPLVILEAMFAGVPVVATDVGSVSEAIRDGETGRTVPVDDLDLLVGAIRDVLDPATGERLGARARVLAREAFTVERMVRDYDRLYRELGGSRAAAPSRERASA
jgi:glycosyltransferase involved in cell wall biosynthesis